MRLYVADYLADTGHLGVCEHGAYLLLLMAMWRAAGKLPADEVKLAILARCDKRHWNLVRENVTAFFYRDGDTIRHKRMDIELEKCSTRSESGAAAIAKRWGSDSGKNNDLGFDSVSRPYYADDTISDIREQMSQKAPPVPPSTSESKDSAQIEIFDGEKRAWKTAVEVLVAQGRMTEAQARRAFARLLKDFSLKAFELYGAILRARDNGTEDPYGYLKAAAANKRKPPEKQKMWTMQ